MTIEPLLPRSDALILFGITGDLGASKIIPALGQLHCAGRLDGVAVFGVGRSERSDADIWEMMHDALDEQQVTRSDQDPRTSDLVDRIDLRYVSGDATDSSTFDQLADLTGGASRPVVYAALPPAAFGDVARAIRASRMPDETRLVLEKPFGEDADSALELHDEVTGSVGEENLFIVDHFLAKAAVENLLAVRTNNAVFDQLLHRRVVRSVTVEMLERGDAAGRGAFYESVGVIDDVVQNHVVQMAALALMERPDDSTDEAYHAGRTATVDAMSVRPGSVVLGQYEGYREHDGVADGSDVATFASFTMNVDSDRWSGVPIHVVTGKALDCDSTAVTFELDGRGDNSIRFGVKPDPTISMCIAVLDTDSAHDDRSDVPLRRQEVEFCGPAAHGALGDYATLLDDALDGSRHHFARIDDIVTAWKLVESLSTGDDDPRPYAKGSAGPTRG